jgi:hypothetical protein
MQGGIEPGEDGGGCQVGRDSMMGKNGMVVQCTQNKLKIALCLRCTFHIQIVEAAATPKPNDSAFERRAIATKVN